ncbi:hypothetical protein GE107_05095 [Cohnella sp. CFH 77786]|uniref:hypothetical protein n=1 Tax=Cohnella sp. CFH 77786 TaxID=2662265 RepID=UPI001C6098F1|nr:hypothetical protein [Cohnella sp. CFH 77786]MBW5445436.1 hypothetical protein [Cohnella sp. CFH 77786]
MISSTCCRTLPNERFAIVGMSYGGLPAQGIIHHLHLQIDGICLIAPAGAAIVILGGTGHMIPIEGKIMLESLVTDWLERVSYPD